MGILSDHPILGDNVFLNNISNEGTADGRYRLTINISGLWILQECKKYWDKKDIPMDFGELLKMVESAQPFKCFIRPDDFGAAGNMPVRIQEFCNKTGQFVPTTKGEILRCALESLALRYRQAYLSFVNIGKKADKLFIVGGGVQNKLLSKFTANALGIPVLTGPVEATAVGNILTQLDTLGEISGREQMNEVIRNSFELEEYQPQDSEQWMHAAERFDKLYRE